MKVGAEALHCRKCSGCRSITRRNLCTTVVLDLLFWRTLSNAIALQMMYVKGSLPVIMTQNLREAEQFLSHQGSDCGIANVNIGTLSRKLAVLWWGKTLEVGRESGSDAWKVYMRRQTNTINYSPELPLAQGIKFDCNQTITACMHF